jgi:hypothetical protein
MVGPFRGVAFRIPAAIKPDDDHGGTVYKFYQLADRSLHPANFGLKLVGTVLESFSINGDTLTPEHGTVISVEDSLSSNPIIWGTAVLVSGGYIYIYGTRPYNATTPSPHAYPVYLARVPVGGLAVGDSWQYYDAGSSCNPPASAWTSRPLNASYLMPGGTSLGFSVTDVNGTYVLLTNNSTGTYDNAVAYYASCPTGFSAESPEYQIYQPPRETYYPSPPTGFLDYEYRIVPQFTAGGDVLISYSQDSVNVDPSCMFQNYYDATIYRPRFIDVQLPDIGGSSGSITHPADPGPPSFSSSIPVKDTAWYQPGSSYYQQYCQPSSGVTPTPPSSPTLTLDNNGGNGSTNVEVSWTMQPTAMWIYSILYCNITTEGSKCPHELYTQQNGYNISATIPACTGSATPSGNCGALLYWGVTQATVQHLDAGLIPVTGPGAAAAPARHHHPATPARPAPPAALVSLATPPPAPRPPSPPTLECLRRNNTVNLFILRFRGSVAACPEVQVAAVQPVIDPAPVRLICDSGAVP